MGKFVWVQKFLSTAGHIGKQVPANPKNWSPRDSCCSGFFRILVAQ